MRESFLVETEYGTVLAADPSGTVVHAKAGSPHAGPLVASTVDGAPAVWLLEAPDAEVELKLTGSPSRPGRTLAVMAVEREGRMCLELPESGHALLAEACDADEGGAVTAGERPGRFTRGSSQASAQGRAAIPFDGDAAGTLLAIGRPEDVSLAAAMLQALPIEDVRAAWLRCTDPALHDHLFPIAQARGASSLKRFAGYTAETMATDIARHGWIVGERTYGNPQVAEAGRGSKLTIGRYCSLANPTIVLSNHQSASASSYPFMDLWSEWPGSRVGLADHVVGDVTIGNDVWIGIDAIILPGARIGDGAIIGAGAVVRGVVPAYAICIGNPAVVKRYRFEPEIVDRLLSLRWWDWPDAVVSRYIPLLLDADITRFLSAAEAEFGCPADKARIRIVFDQRPTASPSWLRRVSALRWLAPALTPRSADARGGP